MKSLREVLESNLTLTNNTEVSTQYSLQSFEKDLVDIFKNFGLTVLDDTNDYAHTNPFVYKRELNGYTNGLDARKFTEYCLVCNEDHIYNDVNRYSFRDQAFELSLWVWYDEKLQRPRYQFKDFILSLPTTHHQGYNMGMNYSFDSMKLTPEYYDKALEQIRGIIKCFIDGRGDMDKMWAKCKKLGRKPQKAEYKKAIETIFKNYLR